MRNSSICPLQGFGHAVHILHLRGGFSIVQGSGQIPLSTSRQVIGAATRNPARARGDQAPIAVLPRPFLK
jgi:hypothetical protein